jgi:hypothetical protein
LVQRKNEGRDAHAIDELLNELAELRELDRRRQAHAPGSAAYDAATLDVDLRSRRLMDRFRDLKRARGAKAARGEIDDTWHVDAQEVLDQQGGSHLN